MEKMFMTKNVMNAFEIFLHEMMAELSGLQVEKVKDLFCNETGYQTPKN